MAVPSQLPCTRSPPSNEPRLAPTAATTTASTTTPRYSDLEVHVFLGDREITFLGRTYSATPFTDDASAAAALTLIRTHLAS